MTFPDPRGFQLDPEGNESRENNSYQSGLTVYSGEAVAFNRPVDNTFSYVQITELTHGIAKKYQTVSIDLRSLRTSTLTFHIATNPHFVPARIESNRRGSFYTYVIVITYNDTYEDSTYDSTLTTRSIKLKIAISIDEDRFHIGRDKRR